MRRLTLDDVNCNQLRRLYEEDELSLSEIGSLIGLSASNILTRMRLCDISRRPPSPGPPDKYHYDREFWQTWHPTMAWVLGLMFADGSVTKHAVTLSSKDESLLWKMNHLGITSARPKPYGKRAMYYIRLGSAWLHDLLSERYGCTANKSRSMLWPDPPSTDVSHFIRGLWDGDGGINRQGSSIQLTYTSGSRQFIYSLLNAIGAGSVKEYQYQYKPFWRFNLPAENAVAVLNWMYADSSLLTRLARKYTIVKDLLDQE